MHKNNVYLTKQTFKHCFCAFCIIFFIQLQKFVASDDCVGLQQCFVLDYNSVLCWIVAVTWVGWSVVFR